MRLPVFPVRNTGNRDVFAIGKSEVPGASKPTRPAFLTAVAVKGGGCENPRVYKTFKVQNCADFPVYSPRSLKRQARIERVLNKPDAT